MKKSCRRGYKLKEGKCMKSNNFNFNKTTKPFRKQIITILIIGMITAFTILIVDGIIGLFGLDKLSNIGKITIGAIAVILLSYLGRNKLGLKV